MKSATYRASAEGIPVRRQLPDLATRTRRHASRFTIDFEISGKAAQRRLLLPAFPKGARQLSIKTRRSGRASG